MSIDLAKNQSVRVPFDLSREQVVAFDDSIAALFDSGSPAVVLDCSRLRRVSSDHIGLIFKTHRLCSTNNVKMLLDSVTPSLYRVLRILDLDKLIEFREQPGCGSETELPETGSKAFRRGFTAQCSANNQSVAEAIRLFKRFTADLRIPSTAAIELETVFYEIIINIRNYASLKTDQLVEITVWCDDSELSMRFVDPGIAFDPTLHQPKYQAAEALRVGQRNGLGLTMVSRMTDNIKYERSDDGHNVLTLSKKLEWNTSSDQD